MLAWVLKSTFWPVSSVSRLPASNHVVVTLFSPSPERFSVLPQPHCRLAGSDTVTDASSQPLRSLMANGSMFLAVNQLLRAHQPPERLKKGTVYHLPSIWLPNGQAGV